MVDLVEMILDIGCGDRAKGDVNLDVAKARTNSFFESKRIMNTAMIPNFVCADANYLPFRNNCFEKVLCHHTLEHLKNPVQALKEMDRVATDKIEIIVPFKYHENFQNWFWRERGEWARKNHLWNFNRTQLSNILKQAGLDKAKIKLNYKLLTGIKYFSKMQNRDFKSLFFYGILDFFLPPTPGELQATINKIDNPNARAT
jgi:ubiquinone/menaquinone biosynthesis C-methylase UbiE